MSVVSSEMVALLVARWPTDRHMTHFTAQEIAKRREAQITRLRKRLSGDLDNVILMSMRKSAQRRYPTAQALADDLMRHLEGQTVTARAPTFSYRAGKFIRRHKASLSAAASRRRQVTGQRQQDKDKTKRQKDKDKALGHPRAPAGPA